MRDEPEQTRSASLSWAGPVLVLCAGGGAWLLAASLWDDDERITPAVPNVRRAAEGCARLAAAALQHLETPELDALGAEMARLAPQYTGAARTARDGGAAGLRFQPSPEVSCVVRLGARDSELVLSAEAFAAPTVEAPSVRVQVRRDGATPVIGGIEVGLSERASLCDGGAETCGPSRVEPAHDGGCVSDAGCRVLRNLERVSVPLVMVEAPASWAAMPPSDATCRAWVRTGERSVFMWASLDPTCTGALLTAQPCGIDADGGLSCSASTSHCWRPAARLAVGQAWSAACGSTSLLLDEDGTLTVAPTCSPPTEPLWLSVENDETHPVVLAPNESCPDRRGWAGALSAEHDVGIAANTTLKAPERWPVVHAGGHCLVSEGADVTGNFVCRTVTTRNATAGARSRITGDLIAYERCSESSCAEGRLPAHWPGCLTPFAGFDCDDPGVCFGENLDVVGTVTSAGDICVGNGVNVRGALRATDDLSLMGNATIAGQLVAVEQVALGPGVRSSGPAPGARTTDTLLLEVR